MTGFHLNAQLIDTRTDTHVWAEEYDRNLNDLFTVQAEIAQKVAQHFTPSCQLLRRRLLKNDQLRTWSLMIFMSALSP